MHDVFYCTTDSLTQAHALIDALVAAGFKDDQLSLLVPDGHGNLHLPHDAEEKTMLSPLPDGVVSGLIGGALGIYAGAVTLLIPGLGLLLAAGPIALILGSAAVGAAVGGLTSILMKTGMPEAEARRHEELVRQGKVLLVVHTSGTTEYRLAESVILKTGITDVTLSARHTP